MDNETMNHETGKTHPYIFLRLAEHEQITQTHLSEAAQFALIAYPRGKRGHSHFR